MKKVQADGIDIGLDSHQFQMKASAKAFSILSSGLYSNKVQAVIRELSCNAYDSQVEAGTADLPFDVKLPRYNDKTFSVRDYGTGLTEEKIYNVYTTYFESTKTESNDYVGALGLGSKSPFCMSESFTIDSYVDGKQMTFVAFIGKTGMPEISKVNEAETNEPNGLKVSFETSEDIYKFEMEAQSLFKWFPVKPNIVSENNFDINLIEPLRSLSDTVKVYPHSAFGYSERILIKQGTVVYPISNSIISQHFSDFSYLATMNLVIEVPLGQVDITASRESLSFVEMTVENLKAKFTEISELINDKITEEFQATNSNIWKLAQAQLEMDELYPRELVRNHPYVSSHPLRKGGSFTLPSTKYLDNKSKSVRISLYNTCNNRIKGGSQMEYPFTSSWNPEDVMAYAKTNTVVIVNDTTRGPLNVARQYVAKNTDTQQVIIIDFIDRKKYSRITVNRILDDLQNPPTVLFVSDQPKPERSVVTVKPSEIRIRQAEYMDINYYEASWWTMSYNPEKHKDAYFVDLERSTIVDNDFNDTIGYLKQIVKNAMPEFFQGITVCGIPKAQKHKLAKAGVETNSFMDLLQEKALEITVDDIHVGVTLSLPSWATSMEFRRAANDLKFNDQRFEKMVSMFERCEDRSRAGVSKRSLNNLKRYMGVKFTQEVEDFLTADTESTEDYDTLVKDLEKDYPMVNYFDTGWDRQQAIDALVEYANAIS